MKTTSRFAAATAAAAFWAAAACGSPLLDAVLEPKPPAQPVLQHTELAPQGTQAPPGTAEAVVSAPAACGADASLPRLEKRGKTGHLLRPIRAQVEAYGASDGHLFGTSLTVPLRWFDLTASAQICRMDKQEDDVYWDATNYGIIMLQFNPRRGKLLAPYFGVGGGFAEFDIEYERRYTYTTSWYSYWSGWHYYDHTGHRWAMYDKTDAVLGLNGGMRLNLSRATLDIVLLNLFDSDVGTLTEVHCDLGFYVAERTQLHLLGRHERIYAKELATDYIPRCSTVFLGAGFSYDF